MYANKKLKIRFYQHLSFRLDILQSSSSGMKNLHANPLAHSFTQIHYLELC